MAAAKPGNMIASHVLPVFVVMSALFLGFLTLPSAADSVLYSGGALVTGQSLVQGNYSFVMQEDCNLVLYDGRRPLWASLTYHQGVSCAAVLRRDGDLVVYSGSGGPLWSSGTGRFGDPAGGRYVLVLQPSGNVVIYGSAIWSTGIRAYGIAADHKSVKGTTAARITDQKAALAFTPAVAAVVPAEKLGRKGAGAGSSSDLKAGTGNNRA